MPHRDENPEFFADNEGLILPCWVCGKLVKFMHRNEEELKRFHRLGPTCWNCQIIKEESIR